MRRLLVAAFAILMALAPVAASAQALPPAAQTLPPSLQPPVPGPAVPTVLGLPPGQALTVGVGIVVGVVGLHALAGGAAGVVAGAVAGALIGNWWYGTYGPSLGPLNGKPAART